ncbi:MAG: hypothetical protein EOP86_20140, partial [Verrucomicrobiaceae bacterium]
MELSTGLFDESGFASVAVINPDGDITVPRGAGLNAPAAGSITLSGANVAVLGQIKAPGGSININAFNISPSFAAALKASGAGTIPSAETARGLFTLGNGAGINAAGLTVDNRAGSRTFSSVPKMIDGGSVAIKSYAANLSEGSSIDVSGGVEFGTAGERIFGKAGRIDILGSQDPNLLSVDGGIVHLGGSLKGYSGTSTGGTLSLQAQLIQVGGSLLSPASLALTADFFNQGGFSTFNLTGLGETIGSGEFLPGILIAPGTRIGPQVLSALAQPYGGQNGTAALFPFEKPEGLRPAANLNFTAKGVRNDLTNLLEARGDLVLGSGVFIKTDALGSVTLRGDTVAVYGSASAPGGRISVTGANSLPQIGTPPDYAETTVYLAPGSRLSTHGSTLTQIDRFGRLIGSVLPGGAITVSGNIVAESASVLDVSGTTGRLDLHPSQLGLGSNGQKFSAGDQLVSYTSGINAPLYQGLAVRTSLDSNGGSISLGGGQMLFTDATLHGNAGGSKALGGTLSVSSGRMPLFNNSETNLVVTQNGPVLPLDFRGDGSPIGQPIRDASGAVIPSMGYFAANAFERGGFDSLTLGGNVEFRGLIDIAADRALRVASGGVIRANSQVGLAADYVSLGQAFVAPLGPDDIQLPFTKTSDGTAFNFAPSAGSGVLSVTGNLIDVGTLSLQGISQTILNARSGEIRGNGTLNAAGRLDLIAGQIYPTTASRFNIIAYDAPDSPGTITIQSGAVKDLPLSAGGQLNLFATHIVQGGVLRAPFGSIRLGWDGT